MTITSSVDINLHSATIEIKDVDTAYSMTCKLDDEKSQLTVQWNSPRFSEAALVERISTLHFYEKVNLKTDADGSYVMKINDTEHGSMVAVVAGLISEGCLPAEALSADLIGTEKLFNESREDRALLSQLFRKAMVLSSTPDHLKASVFKLRNMAIVGASAHKSTLLAMDERADTLYFSASGILHRMEPLTESKTLILSDAQKTDVQGLLVATDECADGIQLFKSDIQTLVDQSTAMTAGDSGINAASFFAPASKDKEDQAALDIELDKRFMRDPVFHKFQ